MITAIYAGKSTEQNGGRDAEKWEAATSSQGRTRKEEGSRSPRRAGRTRWRTEAGFFTEEGSHA